jgi:hypothetical protein
MMGHKIFDGNSVGFVQKSCFKLKFWFLWFLRVLRKIYKESKGNVHIILNTFGGFGDLLRTIVETQGFVRFFCYKGGGGSENPENRLTYYVDVPKVPKKFPCNLFKNSNLAMFYFSTIVFSSLARGVGWNLWIWLIGTLMTATSTW